MRLGTAPALRHATSHFAGTSHALDQGAATRHIVTKNKPPLTIDSAAAVPTVDGPSTWRRSNPAPSAASVKYSKDTGGSLRHGKSAVRRDGAISLAVNAVETTCVTMSTAAPE